MGVIIAPIVVSCGLVSIRVVIEGTSSLHDPDFVFLYFLSVDKTSISNLLSIFVNAYKLARRRLGKKQLDPWHQCVFLTPYQRCVAMYIGSVLKSISV